jgi:hypothetical protein
MLERLRSVLVSSFVGAIALGSVFAQGILHFAYVFSAPVAGWLTRREYHGVVDRVTTGFTLHDSRNWLSPFHCRSSGMFWCAGFTTGRPSLRHGSPTPNKRRSW